MLSKIILNFFIISFPQIIFGNKFLKKCSFDANKINIISCVLSQSYFVFNAICISILSLKETSDKQSLIEATLNNLYFLYAYLCYDICFLLSRSSLEFMFLVHHFVGLIFIHVIFYMKIPSDMLLKYNLFAIIMEGTNPYLNMRIILKNTRFELLNNYIIFITYTLFRVIGYPTTYLYMVKTIEQPPYIKKLLYYKFYVIYGMSLFWYGKILNKVKKIKKT